MQNSIISFNPGIWRGFFSMGVEKRLRWTSPLGELRSVGFEFKYTIRSLSPQTQRWKKPLKSPARAFRSYLEVVTRHFVTGLSTIIVTLTHHATTNPYRRKTNIHNMVVWRCPWHTRPEYPIFRSSEIKNHQRQFLFNVIYLTFFGLFVWHSTEWLPFFAYSPRPVLDSSSIFERKHRCTELFQIKCFSPKE